jgi:hypothetical protein
LTSPDSQALEARWGALPSRADAAEAARDRLRTGTIAHTRHLLAERTLERYALAPPRVAWYRRFEAGLAVLLREALLGERPVLEALSEGAAEAERLQQSLPPV